MVNKKYSFLQHLELFYEYFIVLTYIMRVLNYFILKRKKRK